MSQKFFAAVFAAAMTVPAVAFAGDTITPPTSATLMGDEQTTFFAGLNWTFGAQGQGVEGVLGVAYGEIDLDEDVTGAKASMHFGFVDGVSLDKVKLTGLFGNDNAQAEIGGGYSLKTGAPFAVLGVNGEFFALGTDIFFDGPFEGYAGLHTIGKLSLKEGTTGGTFDNFFPISVD